MTDIVAPEPPHHHRKKTWVTDVNVYSKKKNGDDLNEFFNDDNDPLAVSYTHLTLPTKA